MKKTRYSFSSQRPLRMIFQYHEVFGQSFVPHIHAYVPHERGYYTVVTNSRAIRSSKEYSLHKPGDVQRILVFGDSFTAGEGVNNEERFTDLMEGEAKGLEVINFGLPNSGTDQQLLIYENLGHLFSGDILLLCPLVENINRIAHRYRPAIERSTGEIIIIAKPYFTLEHGKLCRHHVPVPRLRIPISEASQKILKDVDFSGKFRDFIHHYFPLFKEKLIKLLKIAPYPQYSRSDNRHWNLMKALLQGFISKAQGKKVVIAPLPTYHYIEGLSKPAYLRRFQELKEDNPDLYIIDLLAYFKKLTPSEKRKCRYKRDIHYTPFAHRIVANALMNEFRLQKLI